MPLEIHSNRASDIYNHYTRLLAALYGLDEAKAIANIVLEEFAGINRLKRTSEQDVRLSESEILGVHFAFKELLQHKPLQYVLGKAWFLDLTLSIKPGVLIPRPETEELVLWILEDLKNTPKLTGIDIATGSGCIALSLALKMKHLTMYATDVSNDALTIAQQNNQNLQAGIHILQHDILGTTPLPYAGSFDFMVSNPPYVRELEKAQMRPNVIDYEPHLALFVPDNDSLLYYRHIAQFAQNSLKHNGLLYLEINEALALETREMLRTFGFEEVEVRHDLHGKPRMMRAKFKTKSS
jgi:release factor glutamine methyltransferase